MKYKLDTCQGCYSTTFTELEYAIYLDTYTTRCNICKPLFILIISNMNMIDAYNVITEKEYFRYMELNKIP